MVVAAVLAGNAHAQAPEREDRLEEIVVTGSRIVGSAAADRGANPVRVVTSEELTRSGVPTINQFFRKEASFSGATNNETRDEGGGGRATLNLRGIGDQYTLVLVNGRRFAANGVADVGAIPMAAIERMEVLKSGASAIYGSDAVAGVVNIILRDDYDGLRVSASYGNTTDHDAGDAEVSALFGISGDSTRFVGSLSYSTRNDIQKQDRQLTASRDYRYLGGPDRRSGSLALPARITLLDGSFVTLDPARFGPGSTGTAPGDYVSFGSVSDQTRQSTNEVDTLPGDDRLQGWISVEHDLSESLTLFVEGILNRRDQSNYLWSPKYLFAPGAPASNPYNPFGEDVAAINYIFTEPNTALYDDHLTTSWRIVGGIRGDLGRFNYELAAGYFETEFELHEYNVVLNSAYDELISRAGPDALNLFGWGANSPEQYEGLFVDPFSVLTSELTTFDGRIGAALARLPGGELQVAAGFEFREETSSDDWSSLYNAGLTEYGQFGDSSLSREVWGIFGEVLVPIVGEAQNVPGISSLEIGAAVRYEDYNDFGSTTNPQFNVRWAPFGENWILRGSWGTSFRAPPVDVLNSSQTTFQAFSYFDPVQNVGVDPIVTVGGNPNLTPEEADTVSVGTVFQLDALQGMTVALDYWQADLTNIIIEPDIQALLNGVGPGEVIRMPNGEVQVIATAANGGRQETRGWDLSTSLQSEIGGSTLLLETRLAYLDRFDADLQDGSGVRHLAGTYTSYRSEQSGLPRLRGTLNPIWRSGPLGVSYHLNYMSSYEDVVDLGGDNPDVDSYTTHDIQVNYLFDDSDGLIGGLELTVGVDNFTDTDIPFIGASFDGYDRSLADYRGRFYYLQLAKEF